LVKEEFDTMEEELKPQKRVVQDDIREEAMARLLGLSRSGKRTGSDARDENNNRYELKTTTKDSVTTGRDIGPEYLDRIKQSYMICAFGENTNFGFSPREIYFLSPSMMDEWIKKIESRISGDKQLADSAIEQLKKTGWDKDIEKLIKIYYRGITLNNPKISLAYIKSHGIKVEGQPQLHLRELVQQHPISS
jgi:hypothetical protein